MQVNWTSEVHMSIVVYLSNPQLACNTMGVDPH